LRVAHINIRHREVSRTPSIKIYQYLDLFIELDLCG